MVSFAAAERGGSDPSTGARRRKFGMGVLTVAVIAALVVPRILAPNLVGQAFAAPLPEPPAIGSCLDTRAEKVLVVPCGEPHTAEVVKKWRAGETGFGRPAVSVFGLPVPLGTEHPQSDQDCSDPVIQYLGIPQVNPAVNPEIGLWIAIPPLPGARFLSAPTDQGVGALRWSVCVVTALLSADTLTGSVRDIGATFDRQRPAALTDCLALGDQALAELRYVSCDHPHRIEMLGFFNLTDEMLRAGSVETGVTAEQIRAGCAELAATMMSTTDPTHGGRLTVTAEALWTRGGASGSLGGPATVGMQAGLVSPDCFVELVGAGELTGTVIGLGGAPLPLR